MIGNRLQDQPIVCQVLLTVGRDEGGKAPPRQTLLPRTARWLKALSGPGLEPPRGLEGGRGGPGLLSHCCGGQCAAENQRLVLTAGEAIPRRLQVF